MVINGVYLSLGDFVKVCHALLVLPSILYGIMKLSARNTSKDMQVYLSAVDYINSFLIAREAHDAYRQVLIKHVKNLIFWAKMYVGLQLCLVLFQVGAAWVLSIYKQEFIHHVFIILPFTDPNTLTGFLINQICIIVELCLISVGR